MTEQKITKKFISILLAFALLISFQSWIRLVARAEETFTTQTSTDQQINADSNIVFMPTDCNILNYVDEEVFMSGNHIARLPEEETLSSYVFQNADGTRTVYYMDEAVKFVDANGAVREKDVSLTATAGGYVTTANNVVLSLPDNPASGIRLTYGSHMVSLIPQGGTLSGAVREGNTVSYPEYYGAGTALVYTPTLSGVKEDIILSSYTGLNSFTFLLNTGGLNLYQSNDNFYLAESKMATERLDLGQVVTFDAHGRFSIGIMTSETVMAGNLYRLTITVDEEFLLDEKTVYPVSIDPTISVSDTATGADAIEDVTVYSGTPNLNANWPYMHVGYYDSTYKVARTLFRLNGLINDDIYQNVSWANINSVEFHVREATGSSGIPVYLHAGVASWTETGATWNNTHANIWDGEVYATASPGYETYATYNITQLVKDWKQNLQSGVLGFYLKSSNETSVDKAFYSSEYTTTTSRPYVEMTYSLGIDVHEIKIGRTLQLSTAGFASGTVTWASSDSSIASVSTSGVVSGKKAGKVMISATVSGNIEAQYLIYVSMEDGVYLIRNNNSSLYLGVANSSVATGASLTQQSRKYSGEEELAQLWRLTYLGSGEYALQPMHYLERAMKLQNNSLGSYTSPYTASSVSSTGEWTIEYVSSTYSGYVIRPSYTSPYAIVPQSNSTSANVAVTVSSFANSQKAFYWNFSLTNDAYLVDSSYYGVPSGGTIFVELGETKSIGQLILSGSILNNRSWSIDRGVTIITLSSATGSITGLSRGPAVLRYRATTGENEEYTFFTVNVICRETISLINLYDSTMTPELLGYIPNAVEFLNKAYNDEFYLYFVSKNSKLYTEIDSINHIGVDATGCSQDDAACNNSCNTDCRNHHKNVNLISDTLFSNVWSNAGNRDNHIVVMWSNVQDDSFCDSATTIHNPTSALGCVVRKKWRKPLSDDGDSLFVTLHYPIIQILRCLKDDYTYQRIMSITLAHEVAHTLGLGEVYADFTGFNQDYDVSHSYDYDPNSEDNLECIMKTLAGNASDFHTRVTNSNDAFCDGCISKIHGYIDGKDLYEAENYDTSGYYEEGVI